MSGQKQKRPYKHKPILIADEPMPTADQIEAISDPMPIADEDLVNLAKSAGGYVDPAPFIQSLKTETRTDRGRETLDISVVYRVEAAVGRTSNAWGMVDPLELIRAVERVLRGGEG